MFSLESLNQAQREAAEKIYGPLLLLAGAGSGKTRTITYRIANLIKNHNIPPQRILGVTFTNKAAKEMKMRTNQLIGRKEIKGINLCTFHSLGLRILKKEMQHLGRPTNFSIYDQSDALSIIRESLKNFKQDKKSFDLKVILSKISWLKNKCLGPSDYANSEYFDPYSPYDMATHYCYEQYQERLLFFNAIDFDDILYLTNKIFKENPEVARKYSEQFMFIMVDEYQDTNSLQLDIILHLTSTHQNLCVVGDDDQAIYSFRGAEIKNILSFEKNFNNTTVIKLEENYRSTNPILKLANSVIVQNSNRRDKVLRGQTDCDHLPLLWAMADTDHEAQIIAEDIALFQKEGKSLSNVAVLYRSNTQVPPLEEELRNLQIPYNIIGGQKFYEKKEIKDILAYLNVILNPHDQVSLRRVLNTPSRGIGLTSLQKFLDKSNEIHKTLFQCLSLFPEIAGRSTENIRKFTALIFHFQTVFHNHNLVDSVETLLKELDFFNYIDKHYEDHKISNRKKKDVELFLDSIRRFEKKNPGENSLKNFVELIKLMDNMDRQQKAEVEENEEKNGPINQVTLMTLHASKGLEFDQVYLVGVEEELIPHKKTIIDGSDTFEELRLLYVGITRAKKKLIMTHCKERMIYGKKAPRHITRFLLPLKDQDVFTEQDRTCFGHISPDQVEQFKKNFFENLISNID
jgi:DNA helicase II / ATP-dependent DNA helicase PcrA